jgi:hypothetical protein
MNAQGFARLMYRLLLRLHPAAFRQRFGEEMLWIFDLSSRGGQMAYMLYDGVRSVAIQHGKFDLQEEASAPFCLEIQTSNLTVARLGQATLLCAAVLFSLGSLIAREMPSTWHLGHDQQPICGRFDEPKPNVVLEVRR